MPKFLSLILIALVCASCHCSGVQKAPKSPNALVSHISNATVALVYTRVTEKDPGETPVDPEAAKPRPELNVRPYCSGVWISKTVILTAAHCIRAVAEVEQAGDPENVVIHYTTSVEAPQPFEEPFGVHLGSVLKIDSDHDLALVKALGGKAVPEHQVASVAKQMPGIGDDIWCVGHPKGLYFSVYKGSVAEYRTSIGGASDTVGPWVQIQAPVYYGNSGGGAFDASGDLIGIASFLAPSPNAAFYVDASAIRKLLEDATK